MNGIVLYISFHFLLLFVHSMFLRSIQIYYVNTVDKFWLFQNILLQAFYSPIS